jgi:hypothetical protein
MTTVAGQPVGPDSITGTVKGGTKSNVGNTAGWLGAGQTTPGSPNAKITAGTPGGPLGHRPGASVSSSSAATLTSIEAKYANQAGG